MKVDDIFGIHAQALQLRSKRAEVIASNIANADTPGYKARDFDFQKVLSQQVDAGASRVETTRKGHIQANSGLVSATEMAFRASTQSSLDGNTVDSQKEHAAFAENAVKYQASLRFLNGTISTLMTAIKG